MATYKGTRTEGGCVVTVDGRPLKNRRDVFDHSPSGFEWGYAGSGPAQLALCILLVHFEEKRRGGNAPADVEGDERRAIALHQAFKFDVIASLAGDDWTMTSEEIDHALREIADTGDT